MGSERQVNFGIVGCGLIGHKRARALKAEGEGPGHRLVSCTDVALERAEALAAEYPGCVATDTLARTVEHPDVEAIIIATTNDALARSALRAIEAGKHVLVEKPAARHAAELRPLLDAAERRGVVVKVGFNHRFHPGFQQARRIFDRGDDGIGELLYIRARYGHGGRIGYDREWRADPRIAGGGELLDQGVHLIDLARWFAGEFVEVSGHVATYFWDMAVEDNGFVLLKTPAGQVAWLHASCTEWKNLFSFELFGRLGKLQVDGLGGSYGTERLTWYRMLPEMGPPEATSWEYPREDGSWRSELEQWVDCIHGDARPSGSLADALAALEIVERLYEGTPYHTVTGKSES